MGIGLIIRPACTVILSLNKGAFDIRIHWIELIKEDKVRAKTMKVTVEAIDLEKAMNLRSGH